MLKGNWHIVALGVFFGLMALQTNSLLLFLSLLFGWLFYLYVRKKITFIVVSLTIVSFTMSFMYLPNYEQANLVESISSQSSKLANKRTEFTGRIVSNIQQTDKLISFTFRNNITKERILVTYFYPHQSTNNSQLFDDRINPHDQTSLNDGTSSDEQEQFFPYTYRATCTISGTLQYPNEATNPFEFNYRKYLFEQNITYQLIVDDIAHIQCRERRNFLRTIYSARDKFIAEATKRLHPHIAHWQQALIFGDKTELPESTELLFQRWGLSHLLAISGLHVGIIVALVYLLLIRFLGVTKEKARLIVLLFLPLYALFAGGQPSVWRASLMTVFVILLGTKRIKVSRLDIVSIVFLLLIVANKYIIFHVGFQFSFAVTLGLILSAKWFSSAHSNVEMIFQISFIAQMMIVPLQMYYFYHFQPLSILLNVIIVPYFSIFVIPSMFFSFLLYVLPQALGDWLQRIFLTIHETVLLGINTLDRYVNVPFVSGEISLPIAIFYYMLLFAMMMRLEKKDRKQAFYFGVGICLLLTFVIVKPYMSKTGSVTMLDIGQGDTFVIELPYRKGVFFIDAGATFDFENFEPKETVYRNIIRPYLMGRGIQKIDTIFISHAHLDHHGSVRFIIEDFRVDELLVDAYFDNEDAELLKWLGHEDVQIARVNFTEKIIRKGQIFHVVSPARDRRDKNDNSLVLLSQFGNKNWLFTGDISKQVEEEIVRTFPNIQVDMLKVAHHGSNTSTAERMIEVLKPDAALVPVGRNNRYGHPAKEVIELLEQSGIEVFRTDEDGAVQYKYKNGKSVISRFNER